MRTVRPDRYGPPGVLRIVDVPVPAPAAGEAVQGMDDDARLAAGHRVRIVGAAGGVGRCIAP